MVKDISLKFYAHDKRKKGDRSQIFVRLIYDRKKAECATKYFVNEKEWDPARERFKRNDTLNVELSNIEMELREIKQHLQYEGREISAKKIKNIFKGKDTVESFLLPKYDDFLNGMNRAILAPGTLATYRTTRELLGELQKELGESRINVKSIDLNFIHKWDKFLSMRKGRDGNPLMQNTIMKHHSRFRSFCIYLENHDLITKNPYKRFKLKFEEGKRTFLTNDELKIFEEANLGGNVSLERVRDIFLFCVYTGLRFGDAQKMKFQDLIKVKDRYYFQHRVQKSNKGTRFPILPPAMKIIEKYADSAERDLGFILPQISNQKQNAYLKVIADLAGLNNKEISQHVSRHTCATTILLENGVPIEVVQGWLNHSNLRETMIYAKLTNRVVNESPNVEALFDLF